MRSAYGYLVKLSPGAKPRGRCPTKCGMNCGDNDELPTSGQDVIRPIQYLRALAALMVVWHHGLNQVPGVARYIALPDFGPSGVDIFFVISGFIMLVTTAGQEVTPGEFFRRRVIRVVPLYWLMTLLMLAC